MTAYADCPDARWMFEWYAAQEYERMAERGDSVDAASITGAWVHDALRVCEERALYYYVLFYARVANDL